MQRVLILVFCCISYGVRTQAPSTESTVALVPPQKSNWEELTSSHQAFKETAKAKREKFSYIINLLKTALYEELDNSTRQESIIFPLNNILAEEQIKKDCEDKFEEQGVTKANETDHQNALHQNVITEIATQNITNNQNNAEFPAMIPIFRSWQAPLRNRLNQNVPEFNHAPAVKQIPKSRAVSFVPEKIIQTNMNPIPSQAMFNIPCQRAADILDMTNIAIPKQAVCRNLSVKSKVNPIVETQKPNLPSQITAPVTLSVNSVESEDTVAMLFKPKNISLMQLYGNLLKKMTITVLVPYHMSKLGGN